MALQDCGVPLNKSSCIISQDDSKYWDRLWLITQLKLMDPFPDFSFVLTTPLPFSCILPERVKYFHSIGCISYRF